jgi:hypothetical protein
VTEGLLEEPLQNPTVLAGRPARETIRFEVGQVIAGRYRIVQLLGKGGMGEVFRADDLRLNHPVALKFLRADLTDDPHWLAYFHEEVKLARQVTHPNVCRVHDIAEADGQVFLSMEYIDGEDLASLLRRVGKLPVDQGIHVAQQLCSGLAAAHERGVVHRDLKPANVMIDGRGRVRITDFGLARTADDLGRMKGTRAGTPAYMAPEQRAGGEVTTKSDIYSLGVVLFEIFTGRRPFPSDQTDVRPVAEVAGRSAPAVAIDGLDPAREQAILSCLRRDPRERPSSALMIAAALAGGEGRASETPRADESREAPAVGEAIVALSHEVRSLVAKGGAALAGMLRSLSQSVGREPVEWDGERHKTSDGMFFEAPGQPASDLLVVCVHGLGGQGATVWNRALALLQRRVKVWGTEETTQVASQSGPAPLHFDALCFAYPTGALERTSLVLAADRLREAIRGGYRRYRHLVFVAHGAGGLVLKRALADDMEDVLRDLQHGQDSGSIEELRSNSIVLRCRKVINFAVPHSGGGYWYTWFLFPFYGLLTLAETAVWPLRHWKSRWGWGFDLGWNALYWELRHPKFRPAADALSDLEQRFQALVRIYDAQILPCPASIDVPGWPDRSRRSKVEHAPQSSSYETRRSDLKDGWQFLRPVPRALERARDPNDPAIRLVAQNLPLHRHQTDLMVAERTLFHMLELDRGSTLIGADQARSPSSLQRAAGRGMRGEVLVMQEGVFELLHTQVGVTSPETPLLIVTGDIGTGKTVALRTFARSLAIRFLNEPERNDSLPVFFPMHLLREVDRRSLAQSLLDAWHRLVKQRFLALANLPKTWLQDRWHHCRITLIMDSVDEFLLNNPEIRKETLRAAIHELQEEVRGDGLVTIVLGIRWGESVLEELMDDARLVLQVRWLSLLEACQHFPRARPAIESLLVADLARQDLARDLADEVVRQSVREAVEDLLEGRAIGSQRTDRVLRYVASLLEHHEHLPIEHQALSVVRTPLVLAELASGAYRDELSRERNAFKFPHQVLDLALTANLKKSQLHRLVLDSGQGVRVNDWKMALSMVAMAYSAASLAEMTSADIATAVEAIARRWDRHTWPEESRPQQRELATAKELVLSKTSRDVMLDKTVFYPLSEHRRFKHREWQDFLLGRYFAFAFQNANLAEATQSSFTPRAHLFGGNILVEQGQFAVSAAFVASVRKQMQEPGGDFFVGNFGALLAKSAIPILPEAMELLFSPDREREIPRLGGFVLLTALGYRVLRNSPGDRSRELLRSYILPIFRRYLEENKAAVPGTQDGLAALLGSVSYCYLKQMGELPADDPGWPGLDLSTDQERAIAHLHNPGTGGSFLDESALPGVYKTCQTTFLMVQYDEYTYSHRLISLAHYLYTLCLAFKHGAAIAFVGEKLPGLVSEDSHLAREIRKDRSIIPEVGLILDRCRQLCGDGISRNRER